MLKPNNFGWLVMIIGACLVWYGVQEQRAGGGSAAVAVDVDLEQLEARGSAALPGNHIRIGLHHCLYNASVFEYKSAAERAEPSSELVWLYSPIISNSHPYMDGLRKLEEAHGKLENVPQNAKWPELDRFAVLVKSEAYGTIGEAPKGRKYYEAVSGLVINVIEPLGEEEKSLIRRSFPKIDFEHVLILEHGRKPKSVLAVVGLIAAGLLCILLPVFVGVRSARRRGEVPPPSADAVSEWKAGGQNESPKAGAESEAARDNSPKA
jgi:hypothetical protein